MLNDERKSNQSENTKCGGRKLDLDELDKVVGGSGLQDMPTDKPSDISDNTKGKV